LFFNQIIYQKNKINIYFINILNNLKIVSIETKTVYARIPIKINTNMKDVNMEIIIKSNKL